jgi:hypothetical protein
MNTAPVTSSKGFVTRSGLPIFLGHAIAILDPQCALVALSGGCYCAIIL